MFTQRRRTGHHSWQVSSSLLLLSATLLAAVVACSGGVSEEEFNTVVKDLETEKSRSQGLEFELATERADAAGLVEAIHRFEASVAVLESELSKEKVALAERQDRVDVAEAETALLAAFLAWNKRDGGTSWSGSPNMVYRKFRCQCPLAWVSLPLPYSG